jgi:hypothetical protein
VRTDDPAGVQMPLMQLVARGQARRPIVDHANRGKGSQRGILGRKNQPRPHSKNAEIGSFLFLEC